MSANERWATIRQLVVLKSTPEKVYEAWLSSKKHSAFTGDTARMTKRLSGTFSVFGGYCNGINKSLTPFDEIVQLWHFAEPGWPDNHFSLCTISLIEVKGGTRFSLKQEMVPEVCAVKLRNGWKKYYWEPMKLYFSNT